MRLPSPYPTERLALDVRALALTDDALYRLCRDNSELDLELTAAGELIVMTPAGAESGRREARLIQRLTQWADAADCPGVVFSSNAGFTLPNGAMRAPDAAWIPRTRWDALTRSQRETFAPICPDFVVELRSPSDSVQELDDKLAEYVANGARLAWLLDSIEGRVSIHRPDAEPARIDRPTWIDGGSVLPGFRFDFREIL
jgi:Uma2 family endonuclease